MDVTIYHLVGIKVGCTNNIKSRTARNRRTYGRDIRVEILEEFSGTISECADLESEWSVRLGYGEIRPDQRYDSESNKYMLGLKGAKYNPTKGKKHTEQSKSLMSKNKMPFEHTEESKKRISESLKGKMVGENNPMYGKANSQKQKEFIGSLYRGKNLSEEHRKKIRNSALNRPKVTCPHCNKTGNPAPMALWHFDRCRYK